MHANTKALLALDALLLERLTANKGNLLDDAALIGVLAETKSKVRARDVPWNNWRRVCRGGGGAEGGGCGCIAFWCIFSFDFLVFHCFDQAAAGPAALYRRSQ